MRILSLSDIHYKKSFDEDVEVKSYFASFCKKISQIIRKKYIDLVVITGDLAFSGRSPEYSSLKRLLRPSIPIKIPILSVPGNHDLNWDSLSVALKNKKLDELFSIPETEIRKDLHSKSSKFKNIFDNYSVFNNEINEYGWDKKWTYKKCDKTYTAYLYNEKESIILLFLNSSWYSFGPRVIEDFFEEEFKNTNDGAAIKEQVKKYLTGKLSQQGKQSYFFSSFPFFKETIGITSKDKKCCIICFAHHPIHWLKWKELYEKSVGGKRNFDKVSKHVDLLVTGHIHNPVIKPTLYNNEMYHLNNGAFLEYSYVENAENDNPESKFPNNWFNIIDINHRGFNYESYKMHIIAKTDESYTYRWKMTTHYSDTGYIFRNK